METRFVLSEKDKALALFRFLKEINANDKKRVRNVAAHPFHFRLSDLPLRSAFVNVEFAKQGGYSDLIFSVERPNVPECPALPASLEGWIVNSDYADPCVEPEVSMRQSLGRRRVCNFDDDPRRVADYKTWLELRGKWLDRIKPDVIPLSLFKSLYKLFYELEKNAGALEVVVGNGFLTDRNNGELNYPVITKRVRLEFDARRNVISVLNTDLSTVFEASIFRDLLGFNEAALSQIQDDLSLGDYNPVDEATTSDFLRGFVNRLSDSSRYVDAGNRGVETGTSARFTMCWDPIIFVREKDDKKLFAIESIIRNIEKTGYVPNPIRQLVGGTGHQDIGQPMDGDIAELLASVGGESNNIILAKAANREQLAIAKKIEASDAVLVQGPPGTGKTHTIANLAGHFLATGQRVLITSHTSQALKVLKEKLPPSLQQLCIAMLDDSTREMEGAISTIAEYRSTHSSIDLDRKSRSLKSERDQISSKLQSSRRAIYDALLEEHGYVSYSPENLTLTEAFEYVKANGSLHAVIPGEVLSDRVPLGDDDLYRLYSTNIELTPKIEYELSTSRPKIEQLPDFDVFASICERIANLDVKLTEGIGLGDRLWLGKYLGTTVQFRYKTWEFSAVIPSESAIDKLEELQRELQNLSGWMVTAAVDGKADAARQRWELLIGQITVANECADAHDLTSFGHSIKAGVASEHSINEIVHALQELQKILSQGNKPSWLWFRKNKLAKVFYDSPVLDGHGLQDVTDCDVLINYYQLLSARAKLAVYWDGIFAGTDAPMFADLDSTAPERVAQNWIPVIDRYLYWNAGLTKDLISALGSVGIKEEVFFASDMLKLERDVLSENLTELKEQLPFLIEFLKTARERDALEREFEELVDRPQKLLGKTGTTSLDIMKAFRGKNVELYRSALELVESLDRKHQINVERNNLLSRLAVWAPVLAEHIKNRAGIHGKGVPPQNFHDAWKWARLNRIIEKNVAVNFHDLQNEIQQLSVLYREKTSEYASVQAWLELLRRTEKDPSIQQSLEGWRLSMKKLGKGTGKNAAMYRREARKQLIKCQQAVPCWVMPMDRVLEFFDPANNQFDVVIIDEASQSDLAAMATLYMGKKLIIVGDDKQVSPMAVGKSLESIDVMRDTHLSGKIPNAHLFDATTSVYDIASTTFQPLMLREHFRCVPDIIGYSNWLSYDNAIRPLRNGYSSRLRPAVVYHYVPDGYMLGDTNPVEARHIVSLIKACIDDPTYAGKTFGVITLHGKSQIKLIEQLITKHISLLEVTERKILVGSAPEFQGDERDVIFLSTVHQPGNDGTARKVGEGTLDANKKRYNVAVSRAKDQLWVVSSLDPDEDLKPGDLRRDLLNYARDPQAYLPVPKSDEAESSFTQVIEVELNKLGYNTVRSWQIGGYVIDLVIVDDDRIIPIECSGDFSFSASDRVRESMEKQTILQRIGWHFIRVRGSEYIRDPRSTLFRIEQELKKYGVSKGLHNYSTGAVNGKVYEKEMIREIESKAEVMLQRM